MSQTQNTTTKTKAACPKCDGSGIISAFGHIANGVCFCCKGNGTITVDLAAKKAKIAPETIRKAEWLMASTEKSFKGWSYGRLLKARDFAHGGWGIQEAYPELLAHWREVGEASFQAAQERKLEALYS